jgi:hypothetical protein
VASERSVYRYDLGLLERADRGRGISPSRRFNLTFDAAYLTFAQGDLWVGNFVETGTAGRMRRMQVTASGALITAEPLITVATPARVQGVVVMPNYYIYSTSFRRGNSSRLVTQSRAGALAGVLIAPAMSEGATLVGDRFVVVYESAARTYRRPSEDGKQPCRPPTFRIHHTAVSNLLPR